MPESTIPLSGKLVSAVISSFCQPPINGDDTWEFCSIGVGQDSVVATDSNSAIQIGKPAEVHHATLRKEAILESQRAKLYGDPVRLDDIPKNVDQSSGECKVMPGVQSVIRRDFSSMRMLAACDPSALLNIAKVAMAANAGLVELWQKETEGDGEQSVLGFRFAAYPEDDHINLFSTWEGKIEGVGVFKTLRGHHAPKVQEATLVERAPQTPERASRKKKQTSEEPVPYDAKVEAEMLTAIVKQMLVDTVAETERGEYRLPALQCLDALSDGEIDSGNYAERIVEVLRASNLVGKITGTKVGPTVTLYELDVPMGTAVKRIAALSDDFQMQLAVSSVRIQAPIPGKKAIGIEIPNKKPRMVGLFELCAKPDFVESDVRLLMAIGLDVAGRPVYANLASMPHLLIAGATNSGKSIGLVSALCSLLLRNTPEELRLVLVDPKQVELAFFADIPHLMCPVITDVKEVPGVLRALVREMDRRYSILKESQSRNIATYNEKPGVEKLANIVVVVDELADLMMQVKDEVEASIVMLAQKARAVGIHLILATQRPSVDVITGLIKANVPSRMAFAVAAMVDSRVILDSPGAEKLIGRGDLLFMPIDAGGKTTRVQGAFVSETEVTRICDHWRAQAKPSYEFGDGESPEVKAAAHLDAAIAFARTKECLNTMALQREFGIGFLTAVALLDQLVAAGVVEAKTADNVGKQKVIGGALPLFSGFLTMEDGEQVEVFMSREGTKSTFTVTFLGPVNSSGKATMKYAMKLLAGDPEGWALRSAQALVNAYKAGQQ